MGECGTLGLKSGPVQPVGPGGGRIHSPVGSTVLPVRISGGLSGNAEAGDRYPRVGCHASLLVSTTRVVVFKALLASTAELYIRWKDQSSNNVWATQEAASHARLRDRSPGARSGRVRGAQLPGLPTRVSVLGLEVAMGGCAAGTASVRGTGSRAFPSALPWGTAQWGHNPEKHHTALPLSHDNAVGTAYPISDASSHLNG